MPQLVAFFFTNQTTFGFSYYMDVFHTIILLWNMVIKIRKNPIDAIRLILINTFKAKIIQNMKTWLFGELYLAAKAIYHSFIADYIAKWSLWVLNVISQSNILLYLLSKICNSISNMKKLYKYFYLLYNEIRAEEGIYTLIAAATCFFMYKTFIVEHNIFYFNIFVCWTFSCFVLFVIEYVFPSLKESHPCLYAFLRKSSLFVMLVCLALILPCWLSYFSDGIAFIASYIKSKILQMINPQDVPGGSGGPSGGTGGSGGPGGPSNNDPDKGPGQSKGKKSHRRKRRPDESVQEFNEKTRAYNKEKKRESRARKASEKEATEQRDKKTLEPQENKVISLAEQKEEQQAKTARYDTNRRLKRADAKSDMLSDMLSEDDELRELRRTSAQKSARDKSLFTSSPSPMPVPNPTPVPSPSPTPVPNPTPNPNPIHRPYPPTSPSHYTNFLMRYWDGTTDNN